MCFSVRHIPHLPIQITSTLTEAKIAFGGVVVAAAAWSIFGGDLFPAQEDPKGDPETWTREEMRRWLAAVSLVSASEENCTNPECAR